MCTFREILICTSFAVCISQLLILCKADQDVTYNFTALSDADIVSYGKDLLLKPKDEFKEYGKELIKRYYSAARVFDVVNATIHEAKRFAAEKNQTLTDQDPVWKALNETVEHSGENLSKLNTTVTAFNSAAERRGEIKAIIKAVEAGAKYFTQAFKGSKGDKKKDSSKPKDHTVLGASPSLSHCPSVPQQCSCPPVQRCSCPPVQKCSCPPVQQCNCPPINRPSGVYGQPPSKDKTKPPMNSGSRPAQYTG